jgi:hypothetical protein
MTDYTDPDTIDIDTVIGEIRHAHAMRGDKWTNTPSWPNVTVLALANEVVALRREMEFVELLCDGGKISVNGVPWREMYDRINALVADPIKRRSVILSD